MFLSFNARALGLSMSAAESIESAARFGFGGLDFLVRDLVEAGENPSRLRERLCELGLRPGAWSLPMNWRTDEVTFRSQLAELPRYARVAEELGLTRTGTWVMPAVGSETVRSDAPWPEAALAWHEDRLKPIARILEDHGIQFGLEVIGVESFRRDDQKPFIHRLADLRELHSRLYASCRNVGILLDAFHLYAASESVEDVLTLFGRNVVWVHLADLPLGSSSDPQLIQDSQRGLPGEHGAVPCSEVLHAAKAVGYRGPVTIEVLHRPASCTTLEVSAYLKRVVESARAIWPETSAKPTDHNSSSGQDAFTSSPPP